MSGGFTKLFIKFLYPLKGNMRLIGPDAKQGGMYFQAKAN